ncbi:MAG: hypothetical protein EOP16_00560 [Pseudonocardia sp.]|nr:MAG: hypothetical protein EOP16_00560 [Pseudonocardia sp.]
MTGHSVRPRVMHGAFVEFGLSFPPLLVAFQYNPLQLTRSRDLTFAAPAPPASHPTRHGPHAVAAARQSLRDFHSRDEFKDLDHLRREQLVSVHEQTIAFDVRLDATDGLDDSDPLVQQFGVAPQLATMEMMVHPAGEGPLGRAVDTLLGKERRFIYPRRANPPMVLFVFGRKRVLPVNINSMRITETEFSCELNPIRATVAVKLTVIEGKNAPFRHSHLMTENLSAMNLANLGAAADVIVPG